MSLLYTSPAAAEELSDQRIVTFSADDEKRASENNDAIASNVALRTKVLILLAATLAHLVGNSFQLCLGLWLAQYVREYPQYSYAQLVSSVSRLSVKSSSALQSLIAGANMCLADLSCGPAGALVGSWGARKVILVGAVCMVASFMAMANCTAIWQLFLCQAVLQGFATGTFYDPSPLQCS